MKHWNNIAKSLLFTLALALGIAFIGTSPALATGGTLTGDGTTDAPYQIEDAVDLKAFADIVNGTNGATRNTDACAILTKNIDLEGSETNQWTPIGTDRSHPFTGTFNGNNKTIEGLYIDNSDYQGLFGVVGSKGTVKNLTVSGDVSGNYNVGGVVGYNSGGAITGCTNTGTVSGRGYYVGGVVGENNGGTITDCTNTGTVSGSHVGGVVGWNDGGTITGCANTDAVSGDSHVGGVVGHNNRGAITGCTNKGTVTGSGNSSNNTVGGVVGYNDVCSVNNCYNTGNVTVKGNSSYIVYAGGVTGWNTGSGSIKNCYNTESVTVTGTGTGTVGGVVGNNPSGTITNCYYLKRGEQSGIGNDPTNLEDATPKTSAEFATGEVAWLLQSEQTEDSSGSVPQVRGQTLSSDSTDPYPVLTSDSNKAVYFVTVDYNYDDAQEKKTFYSNDINDPGETPPRDGYILTWNKETNDWTITFTAQWSVVYTVTFESNGGSPVEPQTIADGSKVTQPADPTRDGYTFDGWYSDASLTTAWIFDSDTVSKDMTLYAKWKVNEYTVTFASNDGSAVNTQTITYGGKVSEPTAPTREGYTFAGWYSDEALTQLWDFDTVITGNITLYAKWTKIEPEQPSTPSTPSRPTTPSEPEEPSGPSTGDSAGWDDIRDEIAGAEDGDTITIDMNGETEVPADIFEEVAGKDVTIEFDLGDGVTWEVHGTDIPADANFSDLDLGVSMNTSGIPVNVINAITGEATSIQITLAHDGDFGFALTLSAPLGEENAGYWVSPTHPNTPSSSTTTATHRQKPPQSQTSSPMLLLTPGTSTLYSTRMTKAS